MDYWKSKVLPRMKKVFEKHSTKKAAASEACKTFDGSKEEYANELEEKKKELQPKVVEIFEASSAEIKALVKEPKEAGLKKYPVAVQKFLDELVKIEFPGSKPVGEASSKFGPTLVGGPIFFIFEKVSTFIVTTKDKADVEETSGGEKQELGGQQEKEQEVAAADPPENTEPATATVEPPADTTQPHKAAEEPIAAEPPKL